jgi:hypothetical protein
MKMEKDNNVLWFASPATDWHAAFPLGNGLPALPKAWGSGEVAGLRARGGLEVGFRWQDGRVEAVNLLASRDVSLMLRMNNEDRQLTLTAGERTLL